MRYVALYPPGTSGYANAGAGFAGDLGCQARRYTDVPPTYLDRASTAPQITQVAGKCRSCGTRGRVFVDTSRCEGIAGMEQRVRFRLEQAQS